MLREDITKLAVEPVILINRGALDTQVPEQCVLVRRDPCQVTKDPVHVAKKFGLVSREKALHFHGTNVLQPDSAHLVPMDKTSCPTQQPRMSTREAEHFANSTLVES
jgi:hypothetical protein